MPGPMYMEQISCHAGCQEVSRCPIRGKSWGMCNTNTSDKYKHDCPLWLLKPGDSVTRTSKKGYQWPHKKDLCPSNIFKNWRFLSFELYSISFSGGYFPPVASSVRIIVSFWWLFCIVIMATYSGNLIAFLAIDKRTPPFETLHHLADQEEFTFGTLGGSGWLDIFQVKMFFYVLWIQRVVTIAEYIINK